MFAEELSFFADVGDLYPFFTAVISSCSHSFGYFAGIYLLCILSRWALKIHSMWHFAVYLDDGIGYYKLN